MARTTTIVTEETETTVQEGGMGIDEGIVLITFLLTAFSLVLLVMKSNAYFPA
jgi:hypothetical protein